jgi:hypothetical protein
MLDSDTVIAECYICKKPIFKSEDMSIINIACGGMVDSCKAHPKCEFGDKEVWHPRLVTTN